MLFFSVAKCETYCVNKELKFLFISIITPLIFSVTYNLANSSPNFQSSYVSHHPFVHIVTHLSLILTLIQCFLSINGKPRIGGDASAEPSKDWHGPNQSCPSHIYSGEEVAP